MFPEHLRRTGHKALDVRCSAPILWTHLSRREGRGEQYVGDVPGDSRGPSAFLELHTFTF